MIQVKYIQCIVNQQGRFEGLLTGLDLDEIVLKAKMLKLRPFGKLIKMQKFKHLTGRYAKRGYEIERGRKNRVPT